jgi:hypothetical protein
VNNLYAEWLLDGLAGFLTDNYIKRFLGNNEARFRRFKVCHLPTNYFTTFKSSYAVYTASNINLIQFVPLFACGIIRPTVQFVSLILAVLLR